VFASPARDFIPFHDFLLGVHACLLFGEFLARVESLFGACPQDREVRRTRAFHDESFILIVC
jgi:hypothetical protein